MILNDQLQHPISDPPFVAAKKVFAVAAACERKGRLLRTNTLTVTITAIFDNPGVDVDFFRGGQGVTVPGVLFGLTTV
jgi:hypothetical protein